MKKVPIHSFSELVQEDGAGAGEAGSLVSLGKNPLSCTCRETWRDNGTGLGVRSSCEL